MTKDEAERLIAELSKSSRQWADIATLSLYTCMRAGEIFNLKWKDLDLEMGVLAVLDPRSGENRHVFVTGPVEKIFKSQGCGNEYVFKSKTGDQIKEVSETFTRTVNRLGLNVSITNPRQKVTCRTLPHTFASWLALNGETLLTIKELLGHKTITMRYAHLIPDERRKAVERLCPV